MVKGTVQKIETLQDGSVKLSVYVNKELIHEAVQLSFQSVNIGLDHGTVPIEAETLSDKIAQLPVLWQGIYDTIQEIIKGGQKDA